MASLRFKIEVKVHPARCNGSECNGARERVQGETPFLPQACGALQQFESLPPKSGIFLFCSFIRTLAALHFNFEG